jgi:hypothetical protein
MSGKMQAVSGLKMPFLTETKVHLSRPDGEDRSAEVAVNAGVEDSRFAKLQ